MKNEKLTYPSIYTNFRKQFESLESDLEIRLDKLHCPMCKTGNAVATVKDGDTIDTFYIVCKNCWHLIWTEKVQKQQIHI